MIIIIRGLPKVTFQCGNDKRSLTGQELINMLIYQFCTSSYQRKYLTKKLPLDILDIALGAHERYKDECRNKLGKSFEANQEYNDYIHSKEWRSMRKEILSRRNKCENCGIDNVELHLHHLHYGNFKHETDDDFFVLCCDCHSDVHGRKIGHENKQSLS